MAFEWTAFVDLAQRLRNDARSSTSDPEALQRTAVGRAYYGAFGYALDYAVSFLGYERRREPQDDHGGLRHHLITNKRRNAAVCLDKLRQWRNRADYFRELDWPSPAVTVDAAIAAALQVVAILSPPKK